MTAKHDSEVIRPRRDLESRALSAWTLEAEAWEKKFLCCKKDPAFENIIYEEEIFVR
jgi:hypothetical protein